MKKEDKFSITDFRQFRERSFRKKHSAFTENEITNYLINLVHELKGFDIFSWIDKDSKARVFDSEFDFLLSSDNYIIFCEAKRKVLINTEKLIDLEKVLVMLSDSQKLAARKITLSGCSYFVPLYKVEKIPDSENSFERIICQILRADLVKDRLVLENTGINENLKGAAEFLIYEL